MRGKILGQEASSILFRLGLTNANHDLLNIIIDTVHASKEALVHFIQANPDAPMETLQRQVVQECDSISQVNDHFGIGIPMNSFRFTLNYMLLHYTQDLVPEIPHVPFRIKELQRFALQNQEISLVFPEAFGKTWHVGDLSFSVNSVCKTPTFLHFAKPNLYYATGYYLKDASAVKQFSELPK